ncbi:ABC transporter permease [Bacteroidales bacterium OttesenSCG-928-K03]|nr:ABC transporter permease [Bacteroidales bacterium OttesenSCG-928-L14]MDL2240754.1 ABC transporter permease [Bacteroidales bacterium OttesenSCG-928-K22]MDL2242237.1 ABC transporter permease [Bacteroidales bacterium OttesenSCG-928-K03]
MGKLSLIIGREYLSRVKKKTFILMTFLTPILLVAMMIIPSVIAVRSEKKNAEKISVVGIVDESGFYKDVFETNERYVFLILNDDIETEKKNMSSSETEYLLYIPKTEFNIPTGAYIYAKENIPSHVRTYLKNLMAQEAERIKLEASGIDQELLDSVKTNIKISSYIITDEGTEQKSFADVSKILGFACGLLIYMFIFMFGSQVMNGVMEEKSSRIVEVIVSSVKPFQLMMGKIIGIGLVGLTQFVLWVLLTFALYGVFGSALMTQYMPVDTMSQVQQIMPGADSTAVADVMADVDITSKVTEIFEMISSINFPVIIFSFLFYFLAGYLLFASIFAAIGSAVDNETDTQQFMLPVTIVTLIPIMLIGDITSDPNGPVAFWLSMIPFTSPITMMMRIPFGVPYWQIIISMVLLVVCFIVSTWLAGKIYRTGILMYGKKVTWKEMWKWLRY